MPSILLLTFKLKLFASKTPPGGTLRSWQWSKSMPPLGSSLPRLPETIWKPHAQWTKAPNTNKSDLAPAINSFLHFPGNNNKSRSRSGARAHPAHPAIFPTKKKPCFQNCRHLNRALGKTQASPGTPPPNPNRWTNEKHPRTQQRHFATCGYTGGGIYASLSELIGLRPLDDLKFQPPREHPPVLVHGQGPQGNGLPAAVEAQLLSTLRALVCGEGKPYRWPELFVSAHRRIVDIGPQGFRIQPGAKPVPELRSSIALAESQRSAVATPHDPPGKAHLRF